jgi:hypothetical protein
MVVFKSILPFLRGRYEKAAAWKWPAIDDAARLAEASREPSLVGARGYSGNHGQRAQVGVLGAEGEPTASFGIVEKFVF